MKDKIDLLMEETGCEQGEAELALELCGYEVERAVAAIPRLFQNIVVLKGKLREEGESLHGLLLAILNLKDTTLVRTRAVVSYNPAVYTTDLRQGWFDFEKHLYACRLWEGSLQSLSQEAEQLLAAFFASPEAAPFYSDAKRFPHERSTELLAGVLGRRIDPGGLHLSLHREVLDMGQFQQLGPTGGEAGPPARRARAKRSAQRAGSLVLRVALEPQSDGTPAGDLRAGDLVHAQITDSRDIAQYLAKLLGPSSGAGPASLLVPVEAVESGPEIVVRVRFSLGVCGDVALPPDIRLKVVRRSAPQPWWKKLFS